MRKLYKVSTTPVQKLLLRNKLIRKFPVLVIFNGTLRQKVRHAVGISEIPFPGEQFTRAVRRQSLGLHDKVGSERRDKQANNFFINKYKVISYLISWTRSDSPSNTSST